MCIRSSSIRRSSMRSLLAFSLVYALPALAQAPQLGVPIAEREVQSLTVFADGEGLPSGQGSVAEGKAINERLCLACHGVNGQDGINDQLSGGHIGLALVPQKRTIGSYWPYATPIFDYIRRAMPYANPGTLADDQVYALTTYLLHVNDIVPAGMVLDAKTLASIKMPNRERFFSEFKLPK